MTVQPLRLPIQIPQEVIDQLLATMKSKLPAPVDDAVLIDIINANMQTVNTYVQGLVSNS